MSDKLTQADCGLWVDNSYVSIEVRWIAKPYPMRVIEADQSRPGFCAIYMKLQNTNWFLVQPTESRETVFHFCRNYDLVEGRR